QQYTVSHFRGQRFLQCLQHFQPGEYQRGQRRRDGLFSLGRSKQRGPAKRERDRARRVGGRSLFPGSVESYQQSDGESWLVICPDTGTYIWKLGGQESICRRFGLEQWYLHRCPCATSLLKRRWCPLRSWRNFAGECRSNSFL